MDAVKLYPSRLSMKIFLFVIFAGFAGFLFFWNLGEMPLEDYDEATYADVALHTLQGIGHPWFSFFRYQSDENGAVGVVPWIDKPPLVLWLMTGSLAVGGVNELAVRLPSAFFGFLTVLATFFLGKVVTRSAAAGLFAGTLLLFNSSFLSVGREGRLDAPVTFFVLISFIFFRRLLEKSKWTDIIGLWASIGLGVLSKSAVGLLPIPLFFIYTLFFQRRQFRTLLSLPRHLPGIIVFIALVIPWHAAMAFAYGGSFIRNYLLYNTFSRFGKSALGAGTRGSWYYADVLWREHSTLLVLFGVALVVVCAVLLKFWKRKEIRASSFVDGLLFFGVPAFGLFAIFSIASTKLNPYLVPFFPFFSLFIACGVFLCWNELRLSREPVRIGGSIALALVALGAVTFMARDAIRYGWKHELRPSDARVDLREALYDERSIGTLVAGTERPVYLYLWTRADSLAFYSQRPVLFLPRTAEVQIPTPAYLVVPTVLVKGQTLGGGRERYKGKTLTLVEF